MRLGSRFKRSACAAAIAFFCCGAVCGEPVPSARLVTEDAKTKGDWESQYGAEGGVVYGDKAALPNYAQLIQSGHFVLWTDDSEAEGALNKKGEMQRIAACWQDKQFTMTLSLKGGEHRVAFYFYDFNKRGRQQKVEILDGRNSAVLVSRSVSDFSEGKYLVYDLSGTVKIRLTSEGGDSAVVSGLFFGKNARNGPRKAHQAGVLPTTPGFHFQRFYATVNNKRILVPYIAYIPEGYDKNTELYPVIVHLHGAGEGGTDCKGIFNTGVPADFRSNEPLRKAVKALGFWPQTNMGWDAPMTTATIQALDDFLAKARADKDRVYCTGYSMGGRGTWVLAEEAAPRFAAIVPMDPFAWQPEVAQKNLKDCHIWIIVGSQDGDHTIGSKMMYQKMKEVDADVSLTVVPNCGHGAWFRFMPDPTFYDWLLKQKRGSKQRIELPPNGIIEDMMEKFKRTALKAAPNNGNEGSILCQFWRGIPGSGVADLTNNEDFPDFPSEVYYMPTFEIVPNLDDNYGTMMSGFVVPPVSGEYTFWIASDDGSELWLSPDEEQKNRAKIAFVQASTPYQGWDSVPTQKSAKIKLEKGKRYYVEALQKEGGGDDNLSVGWQLPDGKMERPIPGNRLAPAPLRKRGPPKLPTVKLLDDVAKFQKPGMQKLKAEIQFERQKFEMAYCLYLPKDYDAKKEGGFPMFTFLHGNSHQGNDWNGLLNEGPPQMLKDDAKLRDRMPLIGFFPQCPNDKRWDNRMIIQATVALLMEVEKNFNVDQDRVYCTGLSMGGMGTWFVAQEAPWLFAAIAPISAVAVRLERAPARLKDVPTWIICGSEDGGFTDGSLKMHEAFKNNGNDVKLDNVKGEGHGVWGRFYPTMPFYEWLLQHKRKPRAPAVAVVAPVVVPPTPANTVAVAPNPAAPVAPVVQANPPPVVPPIVTPVAPTVTATVKTDTSKVIVLAPQPPATVATMTTGTKPTPTVATVAMAKPAPIVAVEAPLAPPHDAPLAQRLPYAQISLGLAGLAFMMSMYFLFTKDEELARR